MIAGVVGLQISGVVGYVYWVRRKARKARERCSPAWLEVSRRYGLEWYPQEHRWDVLRIEGRIGELGVTLCGVFHWSRRISQYNGLWTHIAVRVPGLRVGFRPRAPSAPWIRREDVTLELASPGFAAYVGLIPPKSEAIPEIDAPRMWVFGDPVRAAELLGGEHRERIIQGVVGRSLYVHEGWIQLNHRSLPEEAEPLARDLDAIIELAEILRG